MRHPFVFRNEYLLGKSRCINQKRREEEQEGEQERELSAQLFNLAANGISIEDITVQHQKKVSF
jgi:hypothetical protein